MEGAAVENDRRLFACKPAPVGRHQGGTGARPAGRGEAGAALPDTEPDGAAVENLRRADVGALGIERIGLEARAQVFQRHRLGVIDEEHHVRVADADRHRIAERSGLDAEMERVGLAGQGDRSPIQPHRSQVDGDPPVAGRRGGQQPGLGLDGRFPGARLGHDHGGDAARAVAAGLGLAAVGVMNAQEDVGGAVNACLEDKQLVAADAPAAVGDGPRLGGADAERPGTRVEDHEIVAEAMHLDERQSGHKAVIKTGDPAVSTGFAAPAALT